MNRRVLIIAAEASSCAHAETLLDQWAIAGTSVECFGVGSRAMQAKGFTAFGLAEDLAVMGFIEVIKNYSHIKSVFEKICQEVSDNPPAVALLIDYPGFNLKLLKFLKSKGIKSVYFFPPQVWAWKKSRLKTLKENVDELAVAFRFEKDFFTQNAVNVKWVGHPLLDEIKPEYLDDTNTRLARNQKGIDSDSLVLGIMPGSRKHEVEMCFPIQLQVAREIVNKHPKVKVLVMVASTIEKDFIQSFLQSNHFPIIVLKDDPAKMIRLAHAVLATSGTATLFVGLLEKPMVIMYRFKFFSGLIAKHFVKGIKFFGLVNLLLDREVVPERWQSGAEAKNLVPLVERSLFDEDYKRQVVSDLKLLPQHLGEPGALNKLRLLLEAEMK